MFDRAVDLLSDGADITVDDLVEGREELRARIAELLQLAREVAVRAPASLPHVPGYEVERELGRGGMGTVYLARQTRVGARRVALKLLPSLATASTRARERFVTEIRALSKLDHRNVVAIHDVVQEREVCAYAMEWVEGGSLADLIRSGQPAAADRTAYLCRVALAIARALSAAHAAGVVHRDVKPSNILIARDGTPLLSDFGLARDDESSTATRSGAFVGTPAYSSPEQLRGGSRAVDARSDVYSLGATLYHALAGSLPYQGHSTTEILAQIERGRLRPLRKLVPKLPRDLETIVAKCMEHDPARRYASANELADDLERLLSLQPIRARRAGWLSRTAKLLRRNRAAAWGVTAGSVASLALSAAVVVYAFFVPRWVDEHVREARLSLLHPDQANRIFVLEFWGLPSGGEALSDQGRTALSAAVDHYDAALFWRTSDEALREERDTVAEVAGLRSASAARSSRCAGLAAFLRGEVDSALSIWSAWQAERDAFDDPDPLVEAALGLMHLIRDEPERAYPRLREANRVFAGVGFLTTYLADAAVQCGDLVAAERWLDAAGQMPRLDTRGALERVRADLCSATGRDREAEQLYRSVPPSTPAELRYARFLESHGRVEEAIEHLVTLSAQVRGSRVQRECAAAVERWWGGLSTQARRAAIRAAVDLQPHDPRSLVARCAVVVRARALAGEPPTRIRDPLGFLVNPRAWFSSPSIESLGLAELAETLEVEDMTHWNQISRYPAELEALQLAAWRTPFPRACSRAIRIVGAALERRAMAAALTTAALGVAEAQNCPNAPCFQGIGDLPGGAFYSFANCLSSDGTTVGGGSATALSPGGGPSGSYDYEAFRWSDANGMEYLGDIAGHLNAGEVLALSSDGSVAVGWSSSGMAEGIPEGFPEAFRWTQASGMVALADLAGGSYLSYAQGISDDGSFIAGRSGGTSPWGTAWRSVTWPNPSTVDVQGGNSTFESRFEDLSRNGEWAVGRQVQTLASGPTDTIRWSIATGYQVIATVPGNSTSGLFPLGVSDDGVVVGVDYSTLPNQGWVWSDGGGLVLLGDLPGGAFSSFAGAISRDSSLIVGYGTSAAGQEAVLWNSQCDLFRLVDVLVGAGVSIPSGWLLKECTDIVVNGNVVTVCGIGVNPVGDTEGWVARYVRPTPVIESYCTAGTTTNNCNATMSATGTPSIAATAGFTLDCTNVEGQKTGLIFYGISGPKASVWAPGSTSYACVKSPVQRTPASNSGGTVNACDGAFSIDFLAYLATHASALGQPFTAGQCVHAQAWFRDPPAPGTTNLSNGLSFVTSP